MKKSLNRQAQAQFDLQLRHRINAGRVAVKAQTAFFGRQFGQVASEWKADDTRVTFADFAISENVFAALRRDFAEDDYCSEEANPLDEVLTLGAGFAWVIDPIDGTNNYALGFPVCAISLALLHDGMPVYGFIYDYSTDALLEGGAGFGLQRNQKTVNRDRMAVDAQAMLGLHFPIDLELLDKLKPLLAKYRVRCLGSGALSAAYVATGYLTGVVDFRVKVWDIAAAYALCAGAGVAFRFLEASPFPLRAFHPQMDFCPYLAGTDAVCEELQAQLRSET
jgi:myo-inositol-1(or 4)-monophosphatase